MGLTLRFSASSAVYNSDIDSSVISGNLQGNSKHDADITQHPLSKNNFSIVNNSTLDIPGF